MRYKVLPGTETYKRLLALQEKVAEVNAKAKELVTEFGGKEWCSSKNPYIIYGGISGIKLANKPKGWKMAFPSERNFRDVFFPMDNNHADLKKFAELPVITAEELNEIVGYAEQNIPSGGKILWSIHPGYHYTNGNFLLSTTDDAVFNHGEDIIEITFKEFQELSAKPQTADA